MNQFDIELEKLINSINNMKSNETNTYDEYFINKEPLPVRVEYLETIIDDIDDIDDIYNRRNYIVTFPDE